MQILVLNAWPEWMDCTGKRNHQEWGEKGFGKGPGRACTWAGAGKAKIGAQALKLLSEGGNGTCDKFISYGAKCLHLLPGRLQLYSDGGRISSFDVYPRSLCGPKIAYFQMLPLFPENGNGLSRGALETDGLQRKFYVSFVKPAHL